MQAPLNVFEFNDYRSFLALYFRREKDRFAGFSYGHWAKKLGLQDKSSISKIVQGHRHPGEKVVEKLVHYFGFNQKQAAYFRDLVRLQKLRNDPYLAMRLMERLDKVHPGGPLKTIDNKTFLALSSWYSIAIKEMINLPHFKNDPKWVAKKLRFKVTPSQVSRAIENLLASGLIQKNEHGQLVVVEKRLNFGDQGLSEAIKNYHEQTLENTKTAVRSVPLDERDISTSTLCMSYENVPKAKELIREFKRNFCKLMEEPAEGASDGAVFQIQIQLLPLTYMENEK